mmetsp:Transcript_76240/g.176920  ORF Transcript_76240/g.176920 Transcript_76240/m.176920 type:complete len:215 (+) Transcript_76240:669-1313(+)
MLSLSRGLKPAALQRMAAKSTFHGWMSSQTLLAKSKAASSMDCQLPVVIRTCESFRKRSMYTVQTTTTSCEKCPALMQSRNNLKMGSGSSGRLGLRQQQRLHLNQGLRCCGTKKTSWSKSADPRPLQPWAELGHAVLLLAGPDPSAMWRKTSRATPAISLSISGSSQRPSLTAEGHRCTAGVLSRSCCSRMNCGVFRRLLALKLAGTTGAAACL